MKHLILKNGNTEATEFPPRWKMSVQKSVLGLAIGLLSVVGSAQAQVLTLPPGTIGLTPLEGRVISVEKVSVPTSSVVTTVQTRVTLEFTLQTCVDQLLPLLSRHQVQGDSATIYVTALNANNSQAAVTLCPAVPKTASAQVSIPGDFNSSQISVVFLGQPSQTMPAQGSN
jgi:hypothetical protein